MRLMKRIVGFSAVCTAMVIFSCCAAQPNSSGGPCTADLFAMDTVITAQAYGENAGEALDAASDELRRLEKLLSVTDADSEISKINSEGSAQVSSDTLDVVSRALEYCEKTDGALDITIYPVLREWGFTGSEYRVPTDSEIASALERTGYEKVSVSGDVITVPEGFMLDTGSCAKGCAGDAMARKLREYGISSALVNLGGNVRTIGRKPDGSLWKVGIADPFSPSEIIGTVNVEDKSVITSGGYQRFFTGDDGNIYIHIIDPETGRPASSGLASVTVIGEDGLMCDALSTALFVMGREKAVRFHTRYGGFDMILVSDSGEISVTSGISGSFVPRADITAEIID